MNAVKLQYLAAKAAYSVVFSKRREVENIYSTPEYAVVRSRVEIAGDNLLNWALNKFNSSVNKDKLGGAIECVTASLKKENLLVRLKTIELVMLLDESE